MKRQARFAVATVALLAVTLVGSACSGDEVPPDGVVTATSTPSEPPPEKPTMPKVAQQKSITGARAFAEHYYNLVEYGHATGQWNPVKKLSKDCNVCQLFWTKHRQLFDKDEDVATKVGSHNTLGIQDNRFEVKVGIEVGVGLDDAGSRTERIERIDKRWQDETKLAYDDGWTVIAIEPDQLRPSESCIAGRCSGYQKQYVKEDNDE